MRLCIVILNHRTPGLVLDAVSSLDGQVDPVTDQVIVVDNDSGDDSAARIEAAISQRGFAAWCSLVRAKRNAGIAAGINAGIRAADADFYLLMQADVRMRPGALAMLLAELRAHPGVGIAGPRVEGPDGETLATCFRDHSPFSEFFSASRLLGRLFGRYELQLPASDETTTADWLSFGCVLMRREVIERVGLLDEAYAMFFEDSDYCRAARESGFRIRYFPSARVSRSCDLRVEPSRSLASSERAPRAFYTSRARYFRKGYGPLGPWLANVLWQLGRSFGLAGELAGHSRPRARPRAWLDNWVDTFKL